MAAWIASRSGRDLYAMLMDGDRPVAYGLMRGLDEGYATPSLGVAVRTDEQGRGLGRLTMKALHREARARGVRTVRLKVHADNPRARALYESLGYVYRGEERGQLVMVLDLAAAASAGRPATRSRRARGTKRLLDLVVAVSGLILLSPLLAAIAVAIRVSMGSPILFRHRRPGLDGTLFTLYKFRTMRDPRPDEDRYGSDSARLTRLGAFLRSASLDELPELWNVLRGEMSLVGPRPLLPEYLATYTADQHRRHAVRPGITGWAAVNGRHVLPFVERLRLDTWYVDHWSLGLDLRIMAMTARQLVHRTEVSEVQDHAAIGFPLPPNELATPGRPAASDTLGAEDRPASGPSDERVERHDI